MLDPFSRGAIAAMSVLCVVGALALAPVRARGSDAPVSVDPFSPPSLPSATASVTAVRIERDPFAGEPEAENTATAAAAVPAMIPAVPSSTSPQGDIEPLPSNLATSNIPLLPGSGANAARITGIVTGAHPYAMVEAGGNHEIKGIGDRINGTRIVSIAIDGITLEGGGRLSVVSGEFAR